MVMPSDLDTAVVI